MANHASHASLPYPVKGARYTIMVPYLNSSGAPTDPGTPDSEISVDGSTFGDCTEEVTTLAGSNGMGYITLTGAETAGSMVALAFKVASGPQNTLITLYPRVLPVLFSGTATAGSTSSITLPTTVFRLNNLIIGCIVRTTGGTGGGGTAGANNQARIVTAFSTSGVATVTPNWEVAPDNTTTFEVLVTEFAPNAGMAQVMAEPTAVPAFTDPIGLHFMYWACLARNKMTQTASTQTLRNDADSGNIGSAAVSDDGTTFVLGEMS